MKKLLNCCVACMFLLPAVAQIKSQVPVDASSGIKLTTVENPVITSPRAGSEISGPFVIVGKSKPNAKITLHVFPIYSKTDNKVGMVNIGQANQYKQQDFTINADASGKWQSPMVEVKFYSNTKDRKIHIFSAQEVGLSKSKGQMSEYKVPVELKVIVSPILLSPLAIGSPATNAVVKNNALITGTGKSGSTIKLVVMAGYYDFNDGAPRKGPTQEFYAQVSSDGKWSAGPVNYSAVTTPHSKAVYTITATVQGSNEKKEVKVTKYGTAADQPLKITSHSDGQSAPGSVQILGTGKPGLQITVSLYAFAEVTPKKNRSPWDIFKAVTIPTSTIQMIKNEMSAKGTAVKEKHFQTHTVTIDNNGKWYIPTFMSFGSPDWMRNAFIPFAWRVVASAKDPNYREGNYSAVNLKCN